MADFIKNKNQLDSLHHDAESWTTQNTEVTVAASFKSDNPLKINLASTLGHNKRISSISKLKKNSDKVHWLPSSLSTSGEDQKFLRETLVPIFVRACRNAGFRAASKGWEKAHQCVVFRCLRGRSHEHHSQSQQEVGDTNDEDKANQGFTTSRPVKGKHDRCPFNFRVYWSSKYKRWFLPKLQSGSNCHCGHIQKPPDEVRILSRSAGAENVELSQDCSREHIVPSTAASLIHRRSGIDLEKHQIKCLNKKDLPEERKAAHELLVREGAAEDEASTAADRLLLGLEANPVVSCVALFGRFESGALTLYYRKKNGKREEPATETVVPQNYLDDGTDSAEQFSKNLRKSLQVSDRDAEILLACAWTDDESRRKFEMFPEFTGSDTTEGTNSEKRPLQTCCGKDSNNKSFTHTHSFLPSKRRWVFDWFFGCAVPALHPAAILRNVVNITDQDDKEYGAFCALVGEGKPYPVSYHRLCAWHKLNRNFKEHGDFKGRVKALEKKSVSGHIEFEVIHRWLWSTIQDTEVEEETATSLHLLKEYLTEPESHHSGQMGERLRNDILEFITQRFQDSVIGQKLFGHHFHSRLCFDNCTSSVNEIEHRAMKCSQGGTRPQNSIDQTATKLNDMRKRRDRRKNREAACALEEVKAQEAERNRFCSELTDYANKLLLEECESSRNYENHKESENKYYVKRRYEPQNNRIKSTEKKTMTHSERIAHRAKWLIPQFERTRVVTFEQVDGITVANCTCSLFARKGICCRHIYSLLGRGIEQTDAIVRWWKKYVYYYGKPGREAFTEQLRKARDKTQPPGVIVDRSKICDDNLSDKPLEHFTETVGIVKLRRNGHWTHPRQGTRQAKARATKKPSSVGMPLTPLAFTTEVHLSQAQLSQESMNDSEMPIPDDCDSSVEESESDDGKLPARGQCSVFNDFLPKFTQITNCVRTQEEREILRRALDNVHLELQSSQAERTGAVAAAARAPRGTLSMPEDDDRRKDRRQKTPWSASKERGTKRRFDQLD